MYTCGKKKLEIIEMATCLELVKKKLIIIRLNNKLNLAKEQNSSYT